MTLLKTSSLLSLPLLFLLIAGYPPATQSATSLPLSPAGLAVSVDQASGTYTVTAKDPAWTFGGTVGAPLTAVAVTSGQDKIGSYKEVTFHWTADRPLVGAIREYQTRPVVQFAVTTPQASEKADPGFSRLRHFSSGSAWDEF